MLHKEMIQINGNFEDIKKKKGAEGVIVLHITILKPPQKN